MPDPKPAIDGYALRRQIGSGGNADVWEAVDPHGGLVALKVLRALKPSRESYQRFQREVREHAQLTLDRFPGVLPLLDHRLPDDPGTENRAWLAMPIAVELTKALGDRPPLEEVVAALAAIADTLTRLHARGLAHRDVKPANCYRYQDQWMISDFGLIQTAEAETSLTVGAKALGPRNFIAPEMLLRPDQAEGGPADVYSLGKALFALAAGLPIPPIGEHRPELPLKQLGGWGVAHPRAFYLDRLIDQMTREIPGDRPLMTTVAETLRVWALAPTSRDVTELAVGDVANAIGHFLERDSQARANKQARQQLANRVAGDLGRRLPEIIERLNESKIPHSGLTQEHAGISPLVAEEVQKRKMNAEAVGWISCEIQRNTGVGGYGFLRFGGGAALTSRDMVLIGCGYHLRSQKDDRFIWSDLDVALLGSVDYEQKVSRLADGLVDNLQAALGEFFKAISQGSG